MPRTYELLSQSYWAYRSWLCRDDWPNGMPTRLHWASEYLDIDEFLVVFAVNKFDINADASGSGTPLIYAMRSTFHVYEKVKTLLEAGASATAKTRHSETALHCLSSMSNPDYAKTLAELLKHGANIDARNFRGCTPFYEITMVRDIPVLQALKDSGAELETADSDGYDIISFIRSRQNGRAWEEPMIKMIEDARKPKKDVAPGLSLQPRF